MGLLDILRGKSKEEKDIERNIQYRKARRTVKSYVEKCDKLRQRYWEKGVEAHRLGDEKLRRRFASGYTALEEQKKKAEKFLLYMEGIKLKQEQAEMAGEFVSFAYDMSESVFEGVDFEDVTAMQENLQRAMARSEKVDVALSETLDVMSESILGSPMDSIEEAEDIEQAMGEEAEIGERHLDEKIEKRIQEVEDAMEKES